MFSLVYPLRATLLQLLTALFGSKYNRGSAFDIFENNKDLMVRFVSLLMIIIMISAFAARAQKVDSIYFNLYTDSLKKQVHNYINVDGKLSNGTWLPLTDKDISFTSTVGTFQGNSLIIDSACTDKKVTIKAVLKSNPAVWKEVTIYVKTTPDNERLKTMEEVLNPSSRKKKPG